MNFHQTPAVYVSKVSLLTENLGALLRFYTETIGFKILEKSESKAVLTADGKTPLLVIEQAADLKPARMRSAGLYHFALLLPGRADLANVLMHLLESGYPLQGASDHSVSEALYLSDPDGNGIEIYRDRPSGEWSWTGSGVHMTTEQLQAEAVLAEKTDEGWKGLPEETVMGHIHLQVSDLKQAGEFYTKALSFDIVAEYGSRALFISTERYHHHIGLNTWNSLGAGTREEHMTGLSSYTLKFPDESARKDALTKLKEYGAAPYEKDRQIYVKDPSGIVIELSV
ncbi:VOC family protein [Metabacillus sp. GX 13764]|uniref:VOC family protein n=1 Tax=Metabacillus kandeliae TaxID=2900151 RepID=UPI001E468045|nr:VOC family protein [Metabacillus kandeliae]MCD7035916.1 VOC family protein [Metabacillus kandeliae]